jgi:uncharacterized protein (DUF1330 family)
MMPNPSIKFGLAILAGLAAATGASYDGQAQTQKKLAYLVAEIEVNDPAAFQAYQKKALETLKPYHFRVLANGKPDVTEGAPAKGTVIILKFDSMEDAQKWYSTSPYKELIPERQKATNSRLYFIEGVPR